MRKDTNHDSAFSYARSRMRQKLCPTLKHLYDRTRCVGSGVLAGQLIYLPSVGIEHSPEGTRGARTGGWTAPSISSRSFQTARPSAMHPSHIRSLQTQGAWRPNKTTRADDGIGQFQGKDKDFQRLSEAKSDVSPGLEDEDRARWDWQLQGRGARSRRQRT